MTCYMIYLAWFIWYEFVVADDLDVDDDIFVSPTSMFVIWFGLFFMMSWLRMGLKWFEMIRNEITRVKLNKHG